MLLNQQDLEITLERTLTQDELDRLPLLNDEVEVLLSAYTGVDYATALEIPKAVTVVALRVAVRALSADSNTAGIASQSATTGPFSKQVTYVSDKGGSNIWLSATDKAMLAGIKASSGIKTISQTSVRF